MTLDVLTFFRVFKKFCYILVTFIPKGHCLLTVSTFYIVKEFLKNLKFWET